MKHISSDTKESIIQQVLSSKHETIRDIAEKNNVGYSSLQKWLQLSRAGKPLSRKKQRDSPIGLSKSEQLNHLLQTSQLDEESLGAYCRSHGIYSHQLTDWRNALVSDTSSTTTAKQRTEARRLREENKRLKQELNRKEKALAEVSALLVLKKKANLLWGDGEDA